MSKRLLWDRCEDCLAFGGVWSSDLKVTCNKVHKALERNGKLIPTDCPIPDTKEKEKTDEEN
jgi:hypothetical protein